MILIFVALRGKEGETYGSFDCCVQCVHERDSFPDYDAFPKSNESNVVHSHRNPEEHFVSSLQACVAV
jgi:hypothetical protein